jgi:hypothetical protein
MIEWVFAKRKVPRPACLPAHEPRLMNPWGPMWDPYNHVCNSPYIHAQQLQLQMGGRARSQSHVSINSDVYGNAAAKRATNKHKAAEFLPSRTQTIICSVLSVLLCTPAGKNKWLACTASTNNAQLYTEIDRPLPLPFPVYTGLYIGVLDWSLHSPRPIPDPTPPQPQSPPPLLRGPADSCRQT